MPSLDDYENELIRAKAAINAGDDRKIACGDAPVSERQMLDLSDDRFQRARHLVQEFTSVLSRVNELIGELAEEHVSVFVQGESWDSAMSGMPYSTKALHAHVNMLMSLSRPARLAQTQNIALGSMDNAGVGRTRLGLSSMVPR